MCGYVCISAAEDSLVESVLFCLHMGSRDQIQAAWLVWQVALYRVV